MTEQTTKMHEMRETYRAKVAQVRTDKDLTWEAKERKIRELGQKHYAEMRELEEQETARIKAQIENAYRREHGPGPRPACATEETAKELRLARIRSEVNDLFWSGRDDPFVAYERAIRAGDRERAQVIGQLGLNFLEEPSRRRRLKQLVTENQPEERKQARHQREEAEAKLRSTELAHALRRQVHGTPGLLGADLVRNASEGS